MCGALPHHCGKAPSLDQVRLAVLIYFGKLLQSCNYFNLTAMSFQPPNHFITFVASEMEKVRAHISSPSLPPSITLSLLLECRHSPHIFSTPFSLWWAPVVLLSSKAPNRMCTRPSLFALRGVPLSPCPLPFLLFLHVSKEPKTPNGRAMWFDLFFFKPITVFFLGGKAKKGMACCQNFSELL